MILLKKICINFFLQGLKQFAFLFINNTLPFFFKLFYRLKKKKIISLKKSPYIKKILVVRSNYLGDMVVFIPVLDNLRKSFPNAHITLITSKIGAEVIKNEKLVNEIIYCSIYDINNKKTLYEKIKLSIFIRKKKYDLAICSTQENNLWFSFFTFFSKAKIRIGFEKNDGAFFFNIQIKLKKDLSEINQNLRIIKFLSLKIINKTPSFTMIKNKQIKFLDLFNNNFIYIGISPFGKRNSRSWVLKRYTLLCEILDHNPKFKIIFFGTDKHESKIQNMIAKLNKNKIINLAGKTSINDLKFLLNKLDVLITIDSGPMHLAAALGINTIALIGPSDWQKWGYNIKNFKVIRNPNYNCIPCYLDECKEHSCMKSIEVDNVIKKVYEFI